MDTTMPLTVLTSIVNTFWQAMALAGLVWLTLKWVRVNAATRGVIWWLVLGIVTVLPIAPRVPANWYKPAVEPPVSHRSENALARSPVPPEAEESRAIVTLPQEPVEKWPMAIFTFWALLLIYRLILVARSYLYLSGVKRNATACCLPLPDVGRQIRLLVSAEIASPMAVGFLRPAILLPEGLSEQITSGELDQILLHEAAHLARRDDWSNFFGRVVAAVLSLHPVAWWIVRQIEFDREAACDDWVVARTGAARPYAASLARMVELRWEHNRARGAEEALASGVFGRGSRIGDRIEMLLRAGRDFSPHVSFRRIAIGVFGLCCLAAAGSLAPQWIAFARVPLLGPIVPPARTTPSPLEPRQVLVAQAVVAPVQSAGTLKGQPQLKFDVASIRPAEFPNEGYKAGFYAAAASTGCGVQKPSISGTLVTLRLADICNLISLGYGLRGYQIVGAPSVPKTSGGVQAAIAQAGELPTVFYDIEARAPGSGPPPEGDLATMWRALLTDRFQLKAHRDTRELSYLALVAGKTGAKMTPARPDCANKSDKTLSGGTLKGFTSHICNQSMDQLVRAISGRTDKPVLDKTELTGNFDFDLKVEFDLAAGDDLNTVYLEAYQKQLGLTLESRKGPVEVLVVDHVEAPSGN